ncbi:MAG: vitamin B12-dependent ribonucleotide reductase [Bdellovibrionales bacterium]|nr:vitamin B12-dependent ribonucleotide reductase [Bdellovibrionales bacterium]
MSQVSSPSGETIAPSRTGRASKQPSSSKKSAKGIETRPLCGESLMGARDSLLIERRFTQAGKDPFDSVAYVKASSKIKDTEGKTVFALENVEVPATWSQLAVDILVSKYFRKAGVPGTVHETSVRQVIRRIAHTLRGYGEKKGYFDALNAEAFEAELTYMLLHQIGAFNSPVWFNLGLYHEYGVQGSGGSFYHDHETGKTIETTNAYERPQCSACFIQSVDDDLMSIFDLIRNEAKLFKYGSGTGSNFSAIRGRQEKLSGGGFSSGLMSFLEVCDKGAGATKSGGTTRRAAKMVCLDMDHPEIEDFITWKAREEKKVAALIGAGYSSDFNGDAYRTVSGQNSNNSVRVTDAFMAAVETDGKWETKARTTGAVIDQYDARYLWRKVAESAWSCADPGVQYDSIINDWHTCSNSDRINASNPCSEYMFLDNTACNLASLNLVKFLREDGSFDIEGYRHACRTFIIAQEILVGLSSYPTAPIAKNSYDYRPLGLGYANLGTMLMIKGIPYDSPEASAWAGALTAIMCGRAYAVSAEEAGKIGPFAGFAKNREPMLRVIRKHRDAAYKVDATKAPRELVAAAREDWDLALALGERHGYRNSQVTVLAPTGTIGLLMDCDTTGIEPDFALVKFKKLAGGGYFKIVNQSVPRALKALNYSESQIGEILQYVLGTLSLEDALAPHVNRSFLLSKGLTEAEIQKVEAQLPGTFELSTAFARYNLGDETLKRLGVPEAEYSKPAFSFLRYAGITERQMAEANERICGTMTLEGAPHLKDEHLPVFDCANKCGQKGSRFIAPMGHVRMMAAAQPFLSGAISKTVNLPSETTVEEIEEIYLQGWKLGLKAIALYRDGSKHSQPLATKSDPVAGKSEAEVEKLVAEAVEKAVAKAVAETEARIAKKAALIPAQATFAPVRRKMPAKRLGFTQEATVSGHKVYIRTGEFDDGTLGEVFIDMHKEGAAYRSMMNCFAISVSLGLQYGVPLKEFVDKFTFTRFEPSGMVGGHPNIKMATSIVDYIFRVLGLEYLGRTDFVQVKPPVAVDLTAEKGAAATTYPKDPAKALALGGELEGVERQMEIPLAAGASAGVSGGAGMAMSLKLPGAGHETGPMHAASGQAANLGAEAGGMLSGHLAEMMGDAPPCDSCGHTTVRNGACYRCLNCGNSMGCS